MTTEASVRTALRQISGVPVTAYNAQGDIDLAQSAAIAARIGKAGVLNVIAAGNTGEYFSLSSDEIRRLQAAVIEATAPHALVTAAVGRALTEAMAQADAAVADGAGAIMAHYPNDPFAGPGQKIDYFLRLADHLSVPLVAYLRSDEAPIADLVRLAEHQNVVAIKYAATTPLRLGEAIRATTHCDTIWVCGLAEGWAPPFYAVGASGFTSGLVNVFPQVSLAIHAALEKGDFAGARTEIDRIVDFEQMRTLYNNGANVTVVKEALTMMGEDVGPVRLPGVVRLTEEERARLREIVRNVAPEAVTS
ncbi:dihydrodipicolinate synthase family protein [Pseudoroseicyclus aestuarii]|uniref:4-hydroxy-tetrahydrodipicolinate synthase n=1 Tax=Pseudoroseicyclus aestuarii TaxID=1795041 RepID=A0A318SLR8_9RHOB|nr:dihydrodipicolinate synthase family protein [Pseudoroseicyclus aestuarii]PYE80589.1 4-hydroxy-tetrahydrodipicolinate synthase [Pseudoroseicyclus aestuarii]